MALLARGIAAADEPAFRERERIRVAQQRRRRPALADRELPARPDVRRQGDPIQEVARLGFADRERTDPFALAAPAQRQLDLATEAELWPQVDPGADLRTGPARIRVYSHSEINQCHPCHRTCRAIEQHLRSEQAARDVHPFEGPAHPDTRVCVLPLALFSASYVPSHWQRIPIGRRTTALTGLHLHRIRSASFLCLFRASDF